MDARIESALELSLNYLSTEGIAAAPSDILPSLMKYAAVPAIDFISLAALAISDPKEVALSPREIREIREFYFPSKNTLERSLF